MKPEQESDLETIQRIRNRARKLEGSIADQIIHFARETGVAVASIDTFTEKLADRQTVVAVRLRLTL